MDGKSMEKMEPPSTARAVMTAPVITIDANRFVQEAAEIMAEKRIGCIVVVDKEKPVGIVTERDLLQKVVAKSLNASKVPINEIMSRPLITINEDASIFKAVRIMKRNNVRRLLVTEKSKFIGIITQKDLLRALAFHVLISFRPLLKP